MIERGKVFVEHLECDTTYRMDEVEFNDDYFFINGVYEEYYYNLGYTYNFKSKIWECLTYYMCWDDISLGKLNINKLLALNHDFHYFNLIHGLDEDVSNFKKMVFDAYYYLYYHVIFLDYIEEYLEEKNLNFFEDIVKPYLKECNKSIKYNLEQNYDLQSFDLLFVEDIYRIFLTYFDEDFEIYLKDKFEKIGFLTYIEDRINQEFEIFDIFSNQQYYKIFQRITTKEEYNSQFPFKIISDGKNTKIVYCWDNLNNEISDENFLWIYFMVTLGFDVTIFGVNKSKSQMTRIANIINNSRSVKLELFENNEDVDLDSKAIDKIIIKDFNQLENEMEVLSQNFEDFKICLNDKEVDFEQLLDVYYCAAEKEENNLCRDYCFGCEEDRFYCQILQSLFDEQFLLRDDVGKFNDNGIWEFDKDKLKSKFNESCEILKLCPFFNYSANKKKLTKIPTD